MLIERNSRPAIATRYATNCTPGSLSGGVSAIRTYNSNGDLLATQDADAIAGVSGHTTTACAYNSVDYTACAAYDTLYSSQVVSVTNDAQPPQTTGMGYQDTSSSSTTPDPVNGWGQWLTSMTDANSQTTLYEYDPLGRLSAIVKPGAAYNDTYASPTTTYAYPITCAATGAQEPCAALTTTQRLNGSDTVTSATYYDGWGRAVETVTPSSLGGTTCTVSVTYTVYDPSGRKVFVSDPYFTSISNDASCAPSYQRPDGTQPGTTTKYDGLGRTVKTTDALSNATVTTYTQGAPTGGANITDSAQYEATTVVDANSHQTRTLADGLGHTRYIEHFTGTQTSGFALYGTVQQNYDWLGNQTSVYEPNVGGGGAGLSATPQTTTTYNLISQATSVTDADLGATTTTYDANGNVTQTVNALGTQGTVYTGYDGLNRQVWRNATTASPTGAYDTYTYDESGHGDGVGRLTTETFNNHAGEPIVKSLAGGHSYTYDERGQVVSQTDSYDGHGYTFPMAYDDAGHQTSLTYSDLEVLGTGYNAEGWLNQVQTTPSGGSATTLATSVAYLGVGGAAGHPTYAQIPGTATYNASYDSDLRLTTDSLTSGYTTLYSSSRGYDAVGNVVSEDTSLGAASNTDNQLFCYDEQNRLVWAGATGTSPCNGAVSSGTLTTAYYSQAYGYDAQGRLTSAAPGSYTYGDPNHPHAVTSIGSGAYSASYDAAGDMTCRAPSSSATCSGVPTGATLTYDAEQRLAGWQNQPSSPTVEAAYLYDGEGNRIEQWVSTSGVQTTTGYLLGGVEERANSGTLTVYLGAKGLPTAIRVGSAGALNYLATEPEEPKAP